MNDCRMYAADLMVRAQKAMAGGMSISDCLAIMDVSKSGYYAWQARKEDRDGKAARKLEELRGLMDLFLAIIRKLSYVPGKRTFRLHLLNDYGRNISTKRCRAIMEMMHLTAARPRKDPYKHQAVHDHPCAAPENRVMQEFYVGPRKIVLTDITYLYYGRGYKEKTVYLCVFRDPFTCEILGHALSRRMDVSLVQEAYDRMMEAHGDELKEVKDVMIHSDQGSVYLSTTFKRLLSDDGFLQSVSARGNSQDNAPVESFFSRLKTEALDKIVMCRDFGTVREMVDSYIDSYNNERYQYSLAGLAPADFYRYIVSGTYPQKEYFGVSADRLLSIDEILRIRKKVNEEMARKMREAAARNRERRDLLRKGADEIISRDIRILDKQIREWKEAGERAESQVKFLEKVKEKAVMAFEYVKTLTEDALRLLKKPAGWQGDPHFQYIYEMKGLF